MNYLAILAFVLGAALLSLRLRQIRRKRASRNFDDCLLKGRKTMPRRGLDDPAFQYQSSVNTDLKETFRRARRC